MSDELKHYGVKGMKWGVRKNKAKKTHNSKKAIAIGASVVAGLLSGSLGATSVYALTGSDTAAKVLAPSLGLIGGMTYYEWINS